MTTGNNDHYVAGLARQLDEETAILSGGYERLDSFQQIISLGEAALPGLLTDMEDPSWCRMQAVWTIAHLIGKAIEYPEEIRGKHQQVRETMLARAVTHGYLPQESIK